MPEDLTREDEWQRIADALDEMYARQVQAGNVDDSAADIHVDRVYRVGRYVVFVSAVALVVAACGLGILALWRMI